MTPRQIFLGVGSDEAIDLLYRIFCTPGRHNALSIAPTYGMYRVCADINDVAYREVPLNADFSLPVEAILAAADADSRLLFVCSPNNPTGNAFPEEEIERLLTGFEGIVVVDEAYIDFSSRPSWLGRLAEFPNLVVLQTLSKAWCSAGVRLGMAFAAPVIIDYFNRVKYPYNLSAPVQRYALDMLDRADEVSRWVADTSRVRVWEKSRRIGASYCEAFQSVMEAAKSREAGGQDTFYLSYNKEMTQTFIRDCAFWAKALNVLADDMEEVLLRDEDRDITVYRIRFASGFNVWGLPSEPRSLRSKQGRVVICRSL